MVEYAQAPKETRDRLKLANWYVGGPSVDGKRTKDSYPLRTMLTLDIDDATPAFVAKLHKGNGMEYVFHTTRSSTPDAPRLRLIFPLAAPISADLHARVVLGLASRIERNPGVIMDRCSIDAARLLYGPTLCRDAPHVAGRCPGAFPYVEALAALAPTPVPVVPHRVPVVGRSSNLGDWEIVLRELGAVLEPSPRYKGETTTRCVWHTDDHPSLDINPDMGKMFCWSCRRGGTVVSYVMASLGCDAREAGLYIRSVREHHGRL
tara:strand:+ start:447 stop:1235 length:789 start_codon:yes stop_codon:yes gene_type:complete